jgi:Family of unknown function (DUF5343)
MALMQSYLVTTKNVPTFFAALHGAKAPDRFTNKFLSQLDFTSSNDRLFLGVLKGLGFIDESGVPTKRYYAFLDQSEAGRVLAEAIRDAYDDLFSVNKKANELSVAEVKNKLKTLTQGQKSDNVVGLMAGTFKALCDLADWKTPATEATTPPSPPSPPSSLASASTVGQTHTPPPATHGNPSTFEKRLQLRYDIHIHLPESRDPAVFDAIFEAMRKHLAS